MTSLLSKIQTIFLASLCIITFSSLKAQNNEKIWTLKRCIEYAKVNNSELKQVELRYKLNQLQLKKAKLNQLPSANINTLQAIQFGKTVDPNTNSFLDISLLVNRFQFSGSMPLFNFYGLNNLIKSEEFNVQDAFLNISNFGNELSLAILNYYLKVSLAQEQLKLYSFDIKKTLKQIEFIEESISLGANSDLNLHRYKSKLALDSSNYLDATNEIINLKLALKTLLNLDLSEKFEILIPRLEEIEQLNLIIADDPAILYKQAYEKDIRLKQNILKSQSFFLKQKANRASFYPSVSLLYNTSSVFSNIIKDKPFNKWWTGFGNQMNTNFNQIIALNINIPIFNNGQSKYFYEQDKLAINNLILEKKVIEGELKKNIYTVSNSIYTAVKKLNEIKKIVLESNITYNMIYEKFRLGGISSQELINAQNELFKAEELLLSSKINLFYKVKIINFYKNGYID